MAPRFCSLGPWLATLAAPWVLAAWGEMLLQGVSGLCSCDEARGKQGGGGGGQEVAFFFFFFSFKEFAASASRSFAVWARREEERERKQLSGTRGRAASRSAPRPCDSEKA